MIEDPILRKKKELNRLKNEISQTESDILKIVQNYNDIRVKALEAIQLIEKSITEADKEMIDFVSKRSKLKLELIEILNQ